MCIYLTFFPSCVCCVISWYFWAIIQFLSRSPNVCVFRAHRIYGSIFYWIVVISLVPFTFFWSPFLGTKFFVGVCTAIHLPIYLKVQVICVKQARFLSTSWRPLSAPFPLSLSILFQFRRMILTAHASTQVHLMLNWRHEHVAFRFNRIEIEMHDDIILRINSKWTNKKNRLIWDAVFSNRSMVMS